MALRGGNPPQGGGGPAPSPRPLPIPGAGGGPTGTGGGGSAPPSRPGPTPGPGGVAPTPPPKPLPIPGVGGGPTGTGGGGSFRPSTGKVSGNLGGGGAPHTSDHGRGIFGHPSTNRPTASLIGQIRGALSHYTGGNPGLKGQRPVDRGIKPPSSGAPNTYS